MHERDMTSDLPGRGASSGAGSHHGIDDRTHAKEEEFASFARYIDDYLAQALKQNKFDKLAIIAAPALLGTIRKMIQPNVANKIIFELDKNLLHCDARQLVEHLPDRL
jgi:protein required for attachment to host cells